MVVGASDADKTDASAAEKMDTSGAEKRRDKAVGVLTPRLSTDRARSKITDGSSTSFSALEARVLRGLIKFSVR